MTMKFVNYFYITVFYYTTISAVEEDSSEEFNDLYEGDIILMPNQIELTKRGKRFFWKHTQLLWPNKELYYEFAPGEFNAEQIRAIEEAISDLKRNTCVKFKRRDFRTHTYIYFRNTERGCASAVGYYPAQGPIPLYLGGDKCQKTGTVQHELLHALGFWHEHTRHDRDKYIKIKWDNIINGREFNFEKKSITESNTQGMPYDYGSVMHYRSLAFSKDNVSPTIIPRDSRALHIMGQRIRFSNLDIAKLNRLYNCPLPFYIK